MKKTNNYFKVAEAIWGMKDIFVNIYAIKNKDSDDWVLVDAGLKTSYGKIKKLAADLFESKPPKAIILTHGHFDHVGSLNRLLAQWHIPVYAHYLELPYIEGKSSYPPPDSSVGGGLMAMLADLYPSSPSLVHGNVYVLPQDGTIPFLKGWTYIHTPGHAPGHVSLFREEDKVLIAGDAFVTTKQESAIAVLLQKKQLCGPPAYFTYDWTESENSIKKLKILVPEIAATGHGKPMCGKELRSSLQHLHEHFRENTVPAHGRYSNDAAVADAHGILYVPPATYNPYVKLALGAALVAGSLIAIILLTKKPGRKRFSLISK